MRNPVKSRRRVRSSALLTTGVMALLILAPAPMPSEAGWIDPEYASARAATMIIPPIINPQCTNNSNDAVITWAPPEGGLPSGMRYKLTLDNDPPRPGTQGVVFTQVPSHTYHVASGTPHPSGTVLRVQVFVVTTEGTVVWESSAQPTTPIKIKYTQTGRKYNCV